MYSIGAILLLGSLSSIKQTECDPSPGGTCMADEPVQRQTVLLTRTIPGRQFVPNSNVEYTFECKPDTPDPKGPERAAKGAAVKLVWQVTKCVSGSKEKEMTPRDGTMLMQLVCVKCNLKAIPESVVKELCPELEEIASDKEASKAIEDAIKRKKASPEKTNQEKKQKDAEPTKKIDEKQFKPMKEVKKERDDIIWDYVPPARK